MRRWLNESGPLLNIRKILKTPADGDRDPSIEDFEDCEEAHRDAPADPVEVAERAALIEYGAGVPREWAEGFARLDRSLPPRGFTPKRWQRVIDDGGRFLDLWGSNAAALGWDTASVFGVDPRAPGWRLDSAGLVMLIDGADVSAISSKSAILRLPTGATQTYRRAPAPTAVPLWVLE